MNNASLELGGTNWAEKDGNLLGYAVGDTSGRYVPREFDFSRGSNLAATRVDENGLIEKGRENLLLQSNTFSDAPWARNNISVTSGQSGYDGSLDAWKLQSSGGINRVVQLISNNGIYTFSVYAKSGTTDWMRINILQAGANANNYYDIANGLKGASPSYPIIDDKIESVGNGWYRISIVSDGSITQIRIQTAVSDGNETSVSGDNIYIQDAQLEVGLTSAEYIETTSTTAQAGVLENTPRLDYSGGATVPSLLLEPSRTNLVNSSEYPASVGGSGNVRLIGGATATYNYGISPEGLQNSTLVLGSNGNIGLQVSFTSSAVNQDWSYSFYIKGTAGETVNLRFELNPYYNNSSQFVTFTGGWQRVEKKISYDATAHTSNNVYITFINASTATQFEIYGVQAEANASYATSYIPTYGTSVTRAADVCGDAGNSSTFNSTEGVLYAEIAALANDGTNRAIAISDGTTSNVVRFYYSTTDNRIVGNVKSVGTSVFNFNNVLTDSANFIKIALRYKANDFKMYVNGVLVATDASGNAPIGLNELSFDNGANNDDFYGKTKQVLVFNTVLTDQELSDLTNPYKSYSEFVTGEGFTWESQDCTNNSIAVLKSLS